MKKLPKLKNLRRKKDVIPDSSVPRITNETVAAHREEVLSSARKYIYPLQHSKHRIVLISTSLFIALLVAFFTYCTLALYRLQDSSTFLYRVTQVIPFPVARADNRFVAYENYLFELRHYMHFYENQQKLDFNSEAGQQQLDDFKHRALDKVVKDAYVKQLAAQHGVSVSDKEVNDQIEVVRSQNRLGVSDRVFEDVLRDYWGWSVDDFRRSLRQELLAQKVVAKLDTETRERADAAFAELKGGKDFAEVARERSDDPVTKENGGEIGGLVDRTSRELSAQTTEVLFRLSPGEYSEIINIGYALQIVKNLETNGDKVKAAHILFNFRSVNRYVDDLKEEKPTRTYIRLAPVEGVNPEQPPQPEGQ